MDDAALHEDQFDDAVKECVTRQLAKRERWLTSMDAHSSDLHRDNDHLLGFCNFGFSRYMAPQQKQKFQEILSVGTCKTPITIDTFESGSAQYNRMAVSLVQLAYAHVACSAEPGKEDQLEEVLELATSLKDRETTSAEDLEDLSAWRLLAGTYAASEVPRCLDRVETQSASDSQMLELALFAIDRQKILKRLSA